MNKKNIISTSEDSLARKLKVLGKKSRGIRREFTKEESELNPESKKFTMLIKKRKGIRREFTKEESKLSRKSKKLAEITKGRKGIRREFTKEESEISLQAKKLAEITKEERKKKKITRGQLSMTEKRLGIKAEQLAVVAKEKESVRRKLAITAKQLVATANQKEHIRGRLEVTAKKLASTATEKESARKKLAVVATQLAILAKEKEDIRKNLAVTAEKLKLKATQLAKLAKEKESVRRKLAVTANELKKSRETLEKKVVERTKDLEQARSKDEAVLASIGDGLVTVDKEGRITYVNQAFKEMIGWKTQEVLGKFIFEIVPREDERGNIIPFKEMILMRVLSGEKVLDDLTNPLYFIRKDKSRFPASIIANSIILKGKIIGAVETFRDITKEKDIDKAKTEFVSLASHQLRTPLSVVNWYTEMLLAGDAGVINDEQKNFLTEIATGNKRMVNLVNDLLNVSRLDMGTFIIESKPTDISVLMKSAIDENKVQILKKELVIEEKEEGDIKSYLADEKLLRMIFQNLLSNAVKYTSDKGTIKVYVANLNKGANFGGRVIDEDRFVFSVEDSGMGIPIYQQDKIFSKLFRADNAKNSDTEGTGLGLYVIKSIVAKTDGEIWFKSEENKGTQFYISFPSSGMKMKKIEKLENEN